MKDKQMKTEAVFGKAMKQIIIIASLVLLAVMISGCISELPQEKETATGNTVTLTVSAVTKDPQVKGEDPATKVSYGTTDATWENGDKIFLIKNDGTTITLTLKGGAGTSSGTFFSTDPVVAGSYIPYAVSATSLSEDFVSVSSGVITLDLSNPGGSSLNEVLQHDILKGDAVTLTTDQENASITGLTTHFLSYIRFTFNCEAKAIESIGMDSAGGLYQTVAIAANGTVTGSNPSTSAIYAEAASDGADGYAGYFAVYDKTTTSLMAHAVDVDGGQYTRFVSKEDADYTAGTAYGKAFTLSEEMVTSEAEGTLQDHTWRNLGLSVKWAIFNVGANSELSYDRNFNCLVSGAYDSGFCVIPSDWNNWRMPTANEVRELFFASQRTWVTGSVNGIRFDCNDSYIYMGAGGYRRYNDAIYDNDYYVGELVDFYISNTANVSSGGENYVVKWEANIAQPGNELKWKTSNCATNNNWWWNLSAMRLVCDY